METTEEQFLGFSRIPVTETLVVVPAGEDGAGAHSWAGDVSDLFLHVFSDTWAEHVYDDYPQFFWEDVMAQLPQHPVEVVVDMVYDFGAVTDEQQVRDYMEATRNQGHRMLILPRTEVTTMCCGWLRSFEIKDLTLD